MSPRKIVQAVVAIALAVVTFVPTVVFAKGDELAFGDAALLRGQAEPAGLAREFERRFGDAVPLVLSGAPYPAARLVALCIQWVVETVEWPSNS